MYRPSSLDREQLMACARGEMFGPGNAQLPAPPMLMFDRITTITEDGGAHGKGFIRAETIAFKDYTTLNGEAGARDAGKLRLEGKEYIVQDGDVLHFRFAN